MDSLPNVLRMMCLLFHDKNFISLHFPHDGKYMQNKTNMATELLECEWSYSKRQESSRPQVISGSPQSQLMPNVDLW